jgi:hypothetical protein
MIREGLTQELSSAMQAVMRDLNEILERCGDQRIAVCLIAAELVDGDRLAATVGTVGEDEDVLALAEFAVEVLKEEQAEEVNP